MPVCNFCERAFKSFQAVKAHLRYCDEYHAECEKLCVCNNCGYRTTYGSVIRELDDRCCPHCGGQDWTKIA